MNIVSSLPDDEIVTLETTNDTLCDISTPTSQTTIKLQSHDDFPNLPKLKGNNATLTIDTVDFLNLMKSVMYAASSSEIKPEISSVYIYAQEGNLVAVSTDSFRLAEKKIQIPGISNIDGIMVPVKNINHIVRVLGEVDGTLTITFGDNQINWEHPNLFITSRTVDGNYPEYEKIIPSNFETKVTLLKKDILDALKILKIFADRFYQVDMTVSSSDAQTTLTSYSNDIGQSTNTLSCAIEGDDIHMRFNGRYMNDALSSITSDSIRLDMSGSGKPLIMSGVGQDDFKYLIMPMNRG
jgi:DNA polymerase-3 subunit beta